MNKKNGLSIIGRLCFVVIFLLSAKCQIGGDLKMITVPIPNEGVFFPTGVKDEGQGYIDYRYEVGETPVTWRLWKQVYDWATDDERGSHQYFFQNEGLMGSETPGEKQINRRFLGFEMTDLHPVTSVSWRDCIVWCNAMTEWYNERFQASLEPIYSYHGVIVRDSRNSNSIACDNVVAANSNGFRLPTFDEWELAARWRTDSINTVPGFSKPWFTKGNSASGATDRVGSYAEEKVSWSLRFQTYPVGKKKPNSLGLYDMSGNVAEWIFARTKADQPNVWHHSGRGFYSDGSNKNRVNCITLGGDPFGGMIADFYIEGSDYVCDEIGLRIFRTKE
ncbi:MAG: SUMF1/EgtB/PvdO family nonheme iron enzyme [Spirochaetales bacterium]|nr:SUMF1/EgtB/PvdO family nonheme iron enzyme [Spirochaetales bacterium]